MEAFLPTLLFKYRVVEQLFIRPSLSPKLLKIDLEFIFIDIHINKNKTKC